MATASEKVAGSFFALAGAQDGSPSAELLQRGFDISEMMVTPSTLTIRADGPVGNRPAHAIFALQSGSH